MIRPMLEVGRIPATERPEFDRPPLDAAIARIAAAQHGTVTLGQLGELGLSARAVRARVAAGRLHRRHRGVYAVGHPLLAREGRWMAAVLAGGPRAVLSQRSAAALWGLRAGDDSSVDVTVPTRGGRAQAGIRFHRTSTLAARDVSEKHGIPCTAVPRTLLDLGEVVEYRDVERAVARAETLRLYDGRAVNELLARARGRRGASVLRRVLSAYTDVVTRSELEELFMHVRAGAGVPRPRVNAWVPLDGGGVEVDFLWEPQRLIVELDGYATHGTRLAFESDRLRDRRLKVAGWDVIRFTWRDLTASADEVVRTLRSLLL